MRYAAAAIELKAADSAKLHRAREDAQAACDAVSAVLDDMLRRPGVKPIDAEFLRLMGHAAAETYLRAAKRG